MMIPSMSRSPVPLLVSVGLALAASAAPLVAQKGETIARGAPKASASDSSGIRLRRLERTIDSLVRIFDDEELGPERRSKLRQQIDERVAEFTAVQMAASPRKSERSVYIRRAPDVAFESRFGDGATLLPRIAQGPMMPGWIGIVVSGAPTQIRVENSEMFMRYLLYPQIVSVDPTSPAQRAGLAPGDTLMAYNGRDVRADEISMTRLLVPKSTVKVRVRRDGKVKDLPVVVADAPARIRERRLGEMRDVEGAVGADAARAGARSWRDGASGAECVRATRAAGTPRHPRRRAASPRVFVRRRRGGRGRHAVRADEAQPRSPRGGARDERAHVGQRPRSRGCRRVT